MMMKGMMTLWKTVMTGQYIDSPQLLRLMVLVKVFYLPSSRQLQWGSAQVIHSSSDLDECMLFKSSIIC